MTVKVLNRNFFQRILGLPATGPPKNSACWSVSDNQVRLDLTLTKELSEPGGAIRLEGNGLAKRILVFRDEQGEYYALLNKCTHAGRRLDPVPGTETVQCCSVSKTTYEYGGSCVYGPGKESITFFPTEIAGEELIINLDG